MKRKMLIILLSISTLTGCNKKTNNASVEKWKQEIIETELAFSNMSLEEGVPKAFDHYAADDAVLMRNHKIISGKPDIVETFKNSPLNSDEVTLTWKPDFVDVSASGDLGYTYGTFTYTTKDSIGNPVENKGIFHTVWKRQTDGNWRFVYD